MSLCQCGCGGEIVITLQHKYDGIPKYINGHNSRGKTNPSYGKPCSEKTKQKLRECHKGKHYSQSTEFKRGEMSDEKHPGWKGGKKLKIFRQHASRRQLGYILLNSPEVDGWVGHHLDYNYVIFIPEELHKSVRHSVTKNRNMNIINDKVYEWFVEYYFGRQS